MKQFNIWKTRFRAGQSFSLLLLLCLLVALSGCTSSTLQSIQIIPATGAQLGSVGATLQFKAIATYTHGSHPATTQDITSQVTWGSTSPAIASVSASGVATAVSGGATTITATGHGNLGIVAGSSDLVVTTPAPLPVRLLVSLAILPGSQGITVGGNAQFVAIGTYSSAPSTEDLTAMAVWKSTQTSVASINSMGVVTGVSVGTATITASATSPDGALLTTTATATVSAASATAPGLVSLAIIPDSQTVTSLGEASQFIAIGTYSNSAAATKDVTGLVTWASSDLSVATINSLGLATGSGVGATAITALITGAGGAVISSSATFTESGGSSPTPGLATLSVYEVGNGTGTVMATYKDPQNAPITILTCGSGGGPSCSGFVPNNTVVTLVATPDGSFGGWSANCTPVAGTPTTCTLTMTSKQTVGAIFN